MIDFDICLCYTDIVKLYEIQNREVIYNGTYSWKSNQGIAKTQKYDARTVGGSIGTNSTIRFQMGNGSWVSRYDVDSDPCQYIWRKS